MDSSKTLDELKEEYETLLTEGIPHGEKISVQEYERELEEFNNSCKNSKDNAKKGWSNKRRFYD